MRYQTGRAPCFQKPRSARNQYNFHVSDNGTYIIRFTPQVSGKHLLHITIKEKPIRGSPFKVAVINRREYNEVGLSLFKFGQYGSKRREFKSPFGVSSDAEGYIYVADS